MLQTNSWQKVKITDLFEIKSGKRLTKSNWGNPDYPYIGSSSINNGKTGMCSQWNYEDIISINYDGSVGYSFIQKGKVYLSDAVKALIPKYNRTDNIDLFICTVLTKTFTSKYGYGKKLNESRLSQELIYLPFKNNEIDWDWIEKFMETLDSKIEKRQYKESKEQVNTSSWKSFKMIDLFDLKGGSSKTKDENGKYPLITARTTNNGKNGGINSYNQENCFTVASHGGPGYSFWHPYKFHAGNNIVVCIPKFTVTNNIGIFISTIITKSLTPKYGYGKVCSQVRISQESIFLPEKDGEPDWEYMENFMNELITD